MLVIVPIILNLPEKACTSTEHKYLKYFQLLNYEHHDPLEKNKVISHPGLVLRIKSYST